MLGKKPVPVPLVFPKPVSVPLVFPKPVSVPLVFPKPVSVPLVFPKSYVHCLLIESGPHGVCSEINRMSHI